MTRLGIHSAWIVSFTKPCRSLCPMLQSCVSSPAQQFRYLSAFELRPSAPVTPRTHSTVESASSEVKYEHTVAQIARAASQAVRVATHEGKLRDAFYVANSVLQSPLEPWVAPPKRSRRLVNPLDFGRQVPTRLVVHSLIHALLREGYTIQAGREINKLISMGVRFRYKTMEASVGLLCSGPSRQMETAQLSGRGVRDKEVLKNDWAAFRSLQNKAGRLIPETRLALDLLSAARESGHRRTERMYGWVVDACLLQGEILVATLLFVILVKDWQLRSVLQSAPVGNDKRTDDASATATRCQYPLFLDLRKRKLAKDIGLVNDRIKIPRPERSIMQSILNSINCRSSLDPCTLSKAAKADYERSLSYLANLVDRRSLPFSQISPLIRALYSCPMSQSNIFILEDDREFHTNVYHYSHEVLLRLCRSLPPQRSTPSPAHPEVLPPLDTHAYNSLIHYALRHRLSPALADSVIKHMTVFRKPPLHPDITTYNILLHSASTLRLPGLANQVLNTLRAQHGSLAKTESEATPTLPPSVESRKKGEDVGHALGQLTVPAIEPPAQATDHCVRGQSIHVDVYTLCTYITHLVRTGRPEIIAEILFHLIPELHIIDHPATSLAARDHKDTDDMQLLQHESLLRAIAYGPYVFTTLLNALQKANKVGLAERVWLLARRAERASWMQPEGADSHAPWCLPIQAYTSMMQCYVNESKKGALLIRGSRYSYKLSSSLSLMRERLPKPQRTDNVYVKGWAYFYLKMRTQEQGQDGGRPAPRWKMAREVGYLLLKSMRSGALSVWQDLMALQPENLRSFSPQRAYVLDSLNLPVADARFYNAVLDMFGRSINMQARRARPSPSWWSRKLRIAQRVHRETGWMPVTYDHTLVEIARGMEKAGYELPLGLRRALIGRFSPRLRYTRRHEHQVIPFAFPRPTNSRHRMFSLCVTKSRGLPLGRRKPEVMRRSRIEARKRRRRREIDM